MCVNKEKINVKKKSAAPFPLQGPFSSIGYSFVKTSVMMIGEFEFDGLFFAPAEETMLPFREVTLILFVAFLIVMSIIIMNLMVGLAVDDIKAVQEQAVLKRLAMQVRILFHICILPMMIW